MFVSLGKNPGQSRVDVIQPHPPPPPPPPWDIGSESALPSSFLTVKKTKQKSLKQSILMT